MAIDMGQMGCIYCSQIRMIGTETGVGDLRNKNAQVQAGKTLVVSSEGKLVWQSAAQDGVTQAGGDISLAAREDIDYQGKLHSGGQLTVRSREGGITQSGTLAAAGDVRLTAARSIQSSGHLLAGSDASSQVVQEAESAAGEPGYHSRQRQPAEQKRGQRTRTPGRSQWRSGRRQPRNADGSGWVVLPCGRR